MHQRQISAIYYENKFKNTVFDCHKKGPHFMSIRSKQSSQSQITSVLEHPPPSDSYQQYYDSRLKRKYFKGLKKFSDQ